MAVSANDEPTVLEITEDGAKGLPGTDGADGAGFNQVRYSKINNPLCHLFKTNQLANASAPTNTDVDVPWDRATTATYIDKYGVVQDAAIGTPREEVEGWLIEAASTNNCLYSKDFSGASWSLITTSITVNTESAPDKTTTADTIDATSVSGYVTQNITILDDTLTRSASVFLKQGTAAETTVRAFNTGGVTVNSEAKITWSTKTATTTYGNKIKIQLLDDDWIRVSIDITNDNSGNTTGVLRIYPGAAGGTTGTCYAWGAQFEDIPMSSSFIETVASSATRSKDEVSIAIKNNVVLSPLSVSFTYDHTVLLSSNSFMFATGSAVGDLLAYISGGANVETARFGAQIEGMTGAITENTAYSTAYVSTLTELSTYRNGVANDVNVAVPGDFIHGDLVLPIGSNSTSFTGGSYMHMKDFRLYDFALNADEITYLGGV